MPKMQELVHVDVERLLDKPKSILVRLEDGRDVWIPKAVIVDEGDDWVKVEGWFASKESMI